MVISTVGGEVVFGLGTATQMNLENEMWGCIMSTLVHELLAYYPYLHILLVAFCSCNNNVYAWTFPSAYTPVFCMEMRFLLAFEINCIPYPQYFEHICITMAHFFKKYWVYAFLSYFVLYAYDLI